MKKSVPTIEEIYNHCLKVDPEKYENLIQNDIQITEEGVVRVRGRFIKGYSGNVKGSVKKKKSVPKRMDLTAAEVKAFGKSAKVALEHLLETAQSRTDAERISSKLIAYQAPKLSNIESRSFEEKTIEIKWCDSRKDLIDITPEEYRVQELAARKVINKLGDRDE